MLPSFATMIPPPSPWQESLCSRRTALKCLNSSFLANSASPNLFCYIPGGPCAPNRHASTPRILCCRTGGHSVTYLQASTFTLQSLCLKSFQDSAVGQASTNKARKTGVALRPIYPGSHHCSLARIWNLVRRNKKAICWSSCPMKDTKKMYVGADAIHHVKDSARFWRTQAAASRPCSYQKMTAGLVSMA